MNYLYLLFAIFLFFQSCTFVRTVAFFKPDTDDHEQIFSCDTVSHNNSSARLNLALSNFPFYPIQDWVPAYDRLGANDLNTFMEKSQTAGFVVMHRDTVLYQYVKKGHDLHKQRIVFSVTKAVTCMLVAMAHEKGFLDINQSIADFFPEFNKDRRKRIKIKHLMDMTSGLAWHDFNNVVRLGYMYYSKNLRRFMLNHTKVKYKPGQQHAYKSISTQLLGMCLEKATGMSLATFLQNELWSKLSMSDDCYVTLDSPTKRNSRAFGGMAMSIADMIQLGRLLNQNGSNGGQQLIPNWFMDSLVNRNTDMYHYGNKYCFKRNGYEESNYRTNNAYWAAGFSGQFIYVDPTNEIIIVRQGDGENATWRYLMGRLASLIIDQKNDLTSSQIDKFNLFEGVYVHSEGDTIRLQPQEARDEFNRRCWTFERNTNVNKTHKRQTYLYQIDGISIGYKSFSDESRLFFDVNDQINKGLFYYTSRGVSHKYYRRI